MDYIIITNNPLVYQKYIKCDVVWLENYKEVLITTRDYIHQGAKLLTHPQAGSIKPYETPYRTVLVSKIQGTLDLESLHYIESALERFISLSESMGIKGYDHNCLEDFQVIDESLIAGAVASLTK